MIFTATTLEGVYEVMPEPIGDSRGWFARTYCKKEFSAIGHTKEWLQLNHSFTAERGTLRGLHYQVRPFREIKLVRCIAGAVYDVVIDLREGSATFMQWTGIELSAQNKKMLYIPEGFAHGFQTLADNSELIYHHSEYYTPGAEAGIRYNDSSIGIQWPLPVSVISDRDRQHPDIDHHFKGI